MRLFASRAAGTPVPWVARLASRRISRALRRSTFRPVLVRQSKLWKDGGARRLFFCSSVAEAHYKETVDCALEYNCDDAGGSLVVGSVLTGPVRCC